MRISDELFALALEAHSALAPPPIARVLIAEGEPSVEREAEFGLIALADGSAGLYYAWLGPSQAGMQARYAAGDLIGLPAIEVARRYLAGSDDERSVGMAAINALTEHTYRRAGFRPAAATDSFAGLDPRAGDHLGMIGNFPSLVRQARARGAHVSVLERKAHMVTRADGLEIALDPVVLHGCNKIVCTGATLLNDSLDAVLEHCRGAEVVALVGPTVGCFPDPMFARDIDRVAGTRVLDCGLAAARLAAGHKLGDAAERTQIARGGYPGFAALLARACDRG